MTGQRAMFACVDGPSRILMNDLHNCRILSHAIKRVIFQNNPPRLILSANTDMGSSKKSCSKGILESYGLPGAKRVFAMEY